MRTFLVIGAVLVLAIVGSYMLHGISARVLVGLPTQTATDTMRFEIVATPAQQQLGLGGRAAIPDNYGMLFVFPTANRYGFWMKDMLVPIDIMWLSDSGAIVNIEDSVATSTYPKIFYPSEPVRYVLETRAGYASDHGWGVGSVVSLPAPYGEATTSQVN